MASTTDPRAAGFNAATVRDALRFAMSIGVPDATQERVTFRWSERQTFDNADPAADPYDWTQAPATDVSHPDVQVPVAIELAAVASTGEGNTVGQFESTPAVATILDEDYDQVRGADQVLFGAKTYGIDKVVPLGLFDLTVYQLHLVETL